MIKTINDSIKHLFFMWNKGHWKVTTDNSRDAINKLSDYVEKNQEKQLKENLLFAKLYIAHLSYLVKLHRASFRSPIPQKELHKLLDMPIERIIEEFVSTINDIEQSKVMEINRDLKHPITWTKEERASMKIIEPTIDYDFAEDNLTAMINLALDQYS